MINTFKITTVLAAFLIAASFSSISYAEDVASHPAVSGQSDDEISTSIETMFSKDATLKVLDIDVDTANGIVTLSGSVPTQADADHAVAVAETAMGVKSVDSQLKVGKDPSAGQKVEQLEQKTKEALHKAGTAIEDTKITTAVKLKFASDDTVKKAKIDVDTDNGIVTLKGTVDSQVEADRAVQLARRVGGVKEVHSKLIVRG